jgi:hypothetical protein
MSIGGQAVRTDTMSIPSTRINQGAGRHYPGGKLTLREPRGDVRGHGRRDSDYVPDRRGPDRANVARAVWALTQMEMIGRRLAVVLVGLLIAMAIAVVLRLHVIAIPDL